MRLGRKQHPSNSSILRASLKDLTLDFDGDLDLDFDCSAFNQKLVDDGLVLLNLRTLHF
jgi:hypothetical protein